MGINDGFILSPVGRHHLHHHLLREELSAYYPARPSLSSLHHDATVFPRIERSLHSRHRSQCRSPFLSPDLYRPTHSRDKARNAEHYNLYLQTLKIITVDFATKYKLTALRDALAAAFDGEDEAYLQSRSFADTKEIDEKDAVRDKRFRFIFLTTESKELSLVEAEAKAAEKVAFAIAPYTGAASKPFAENTAMVEDMVKKLQSAEYTSYMQRLGLTDAVVALKTANDDFVAAFSRRADEKRIRSVSDNLKKLRPVTDEAAHKLFDAIYGPVLSS